MNWFAGFLPTVGNPMLNFKVYRVPCFVALTFFVAPAHRSLPVQPSDDSPCWRRKRVRNAMRSACHWCNGCRVPWKWQCKRWSTTNDRMRCENHVEMKHWSLFFIAKNMWRKKMAKNSPWKGPRPCEKHTTYWNPWNRWLMLIASAKGSTRLRVGVSGPIHGR